MSGVCLAVNGSRSETSRLKERFDSFGQLFGYYIFVKHDICSMRTLLPEKNFTYGNGSNPTNDHRELQACFIGDVELFLELLMPYDREMLEKWYMDNQATCESIARHLNKNRNRFMCPKQFFFRQNVHKRIFRLKNYARKYFSRKGYL